MSRRLWAVLLTLPLGFLLMTAPAQADPTCPEGGMCFWTGYSYTGTRHVIDARNLVPPGACAVINPTGSVATVYRSFKNRARDTVIAPAWVTSTGTQCSYEVVLRYGEDVPRLYPTSTTRPDYVRHYLRLR